MRQKYVIAIIVGIFLCLGFSVYATDTIRSYIRETTTLGPNSYPDQHITTLSGASLINVDNDNLLTGDYFSGEYYDSAYGVFYVDAINDDKVRISDESISKCDNNSTHDGYKLYGSSWNPSFGAVDFNYDSSNYVYICVPRDENSELDSYLGGYAYSDLIGFQNFDGVIFDVYVDRDEEHASDARYVKVDGIASSANHDNVDEEYKNDVRVIGKINKSTLRAEMLKKIYSVIKSESSNNGNKIVDSAQWNTWSTSGGGKALQNGSVLYFGDLNGLNIELNGTDNIGGVKTIIAEGGNIYITENLRNSDNDNAILGIVALQKDGKGGNVYIDPTVTDIHASIYADRAVISYKESEMDGNTPDSKLANQLYIHGSIFSENTLGGADADPKKCPFYENNECNDALAKKYDFNYLRRYILVSEVANGEVTGNKFPKDNAVESYMGDDDNTNTETQKPGYRVYPVIIEYNPDIQQNPPPFF